MSRPELGEERGRARAAFAAYLRGPRAGCFVVPRAEDGCDCDVFLPALASRLGLAWRVLVMAVSRLLPSGCGKSTALRLTGMRIGRDVFVAPGVVIDPLWPCLIEIGDGVVLGMGCRLLTHECSATEFRVGGVRIGDRSVIGAGATVRSGVTVGRRATVGCNSFVNADVADGATVGGVPARPIVG